MSITRRSLIGSFLALPFIAKLKAKESPMQTFESGTPVVLHGITNIRQDRIIQLEPKDIKADYVSLSKDQFKTHLELKTFRPVDLHDIIEVELAGIKFRGRVSLIEVTACYLDLTIYHVWAECDTI